MNSRIIELDENGENVLEICQDSKFGYAGEVWDGALVLIHFLINKNNKHKFSVKDKVVLELGAGTGSVGLLAGALGAKKVYLTDKEEYLGILEINYDLNKDLVKNSEIVVQALDWRDYDKFGSLLKDKIDIIICSELVWNTLYFDDLINTLDYFCTPGHTEIIMSYQYRQKSDLEFFNKIKLNKNFIVEKIPDTWFDEDYKAEDIFIFLIRKNLV